MGRIVRLSEDAISQSIFGDNSDFMFDYMEDQLSRFGDNSNSHVYSSIRSSMDYISDEFRRREIRDELRRNRVKERNDDFGLIDSFDLLRGADLRSQRWIMTEPSVRKLYLEQNLDGYSGSYQNITEGIGKDDYNFRLITDGMLLEDENGDGDVTYYFDDLLPGDRRPKQYEKEDTLGMWEFIRAQMKLSDKDFTNPHSDDSEMNR